MAFQQPQVGSSEVNQWREPLKIIPFLSILAIGLAAPAFAQQAAPPSTADAPAAQAPAAQSATAKAGDQIYDTAGAVVGTVESVSGSNFVISTGTSKATLPMSSLANGTNGLTISMTKAQLNDAIQQATGKAH
jgi:hypothetical protein